MVYGPTLFVLGMLLVLKYQAQIAIMDLMRDPAAVMETPFYIGLLSNAGVLLWWATAAVCLFSSSVLRGATHYKELRSFFQFSGLLTATLTLDDFFLLHESVFPKYFNLSEKFVYLIYGLTLLLYLYRFKKIILKTNFVLLLFAFWFFGFSVLIDKILPFSELSVFLEDGAKLLGIVSWLAYFIRTCLQSIQAYHFAKGTNLVESSLLVKR